MFEALLSSGMAPVGIYYPDSGPGTKYLTIGNEDAGYFGMVETDEMPDQVTTQAALNIPAGATLSAALAPKFFWWKFFWKGNVLYVPSDSIFNACSWDTIYNTGLLYGEEGFGKFQTTTPTDQMTKINYTTKSGEVNTFIVRTIQGSAADPSTATAVNEPNEFATLLNMVPNLNNNLNNVTPYRLHMSQLTYNTGANNARYVTRRLTGANAVANDEVAKGLAYEWRPTLVYIRNQLYSPYSVYSEFLGNRGPIDVHGTDVDLVYNPKNLIAVDDSVVPPVEMQSVAIYEAVDNPFIGNYTINFIPVSLEITNS